MTLVIALLLLAGQIFPAYGATDSSSADSDATIEVEVEPKKELPTRGQRIPALPRICHISTATGVWMTGVEKNEIISFELYDSTELPIGIFSDEKDFVEIFFSNLYPQIYKICLVTEDARYIGYVN